MTWVWQLINCFLFLPDMLLRLQMVTLTLGRSTYAWNGKFTKARVATCININCPAVAVVTARQLTTISSRVVRVAYPLLLRFYATSSCPIM